ncbi:hypothetical protein BDV93DRAFT_584062 [Ceratobasidium sp. AG-I]|nr:hypothetical protein BDV93DRAFT_584062 [Ceratobasidium sp. AG-I]
MTDPMINVQLAHNQQFYGQTDVAMQTADDLHRLLGIKIEELVEYKTHPFSITFRGVEHELEFRVKDVMSTIDSIVQDPELAPHFIWYPERLYYPHPDGSTNIQVWEEMHHGADWWYIQSSIGPEGVVLYIYLSMDETKVSTIGQKKLWPVYLWLGNVPASKRRGSGPGGAELLCYLAKGSTKDIPTAHQGTFNILVYQEAMRIILGALRTSAEFGRLVRCGDKKTRLCFDTLAVISVDYAELMRVLFMRGTQSTFQCPVCLVPRDKLHDLTCLWPLRSNTGTIDLLQKVQNTANKLEKEKLLLSQSIREVESVFIELTTPHFDLYKTIIVDPLHQIEQGIFHHLWDWLKESMTLAERKTLDERFTMVSSAQELKHFNNGVTHLRYLAGYELGIILKPSQSIPLLQYTRLLSMIYSLSKFTTHTSITLQWMQDYILRINELALTLHQEFDLSFSYPKWHSLSHMVDILRRKSSSDNYHTGFGESLHPQVKDDYARSNKQPDAVNQMLRMHQERRAIQAIDKQLACFQQSDLLASEVEELESSMGHIQLGSKQSSFLGAQFFSHLPDEPEFHRLVYKLQVFVYQNIPIPGLVVKQNFRQSDLPKVDKILITCYHLARASYISQVDHLDHVDLIRCNPNWMGKTKRQDYVLLLLRLTINDVQHPVALVQHPVALVRQFVTVGRNESTGHIEVQDDGHILFIDLELIDRACVFLPSTQSSDIAVSDLCDHDMHRNILHIKTEPSRLLADPTSKFYALCKSAGPQEFLTLKKMADDASQGRRDPAPK